MERNVDAVTPTPPNVETRRKPNEEQLAHVLDSTLKVDPEKNEVAVIFKPFECLNTYTFMLTTTPIRTAVMVERINPVTASSGR
ncbi:MAG: hypothetical protein WAZ77_08885 [Candidatus Nitrosopolaris sp.]